MSASKVVLISIDMESVTKGVVEASLKFRNISSTLMMMIAFTTFNSSLVPLFKGS